MKRAPGCTLFALFLSNLSSTVSSVEYGCSPARFATNAVYGVANVASEMSMDTIEVTWAV